MAVDRKAAENKLATEVFGGRSIIVPSKKFAVFEYGSRDGGRAINRYPDGPGSAGPNFPIAAKAMWELNLKGCFHEFGHA
jgi:hypothetical protein